MVTRFALLVALSVVLLSPKILHAETATFGSRVLSEGDSIARVYEVAGKPDRVVRLENKYGGAVGERFEYYRDGRTISVTVSGGRVIRIDVSNG